MKVQNGSLRDMYTSRTKFKIKKTVSFSSELYRKLLCTYDCIMRCFIYIYLHSKRVKVAPRELLTWFGEKQDDNHWLVSYRLQHSGRTTTLGDEHNIINLLYQFPAWLMSTIIKKNHQIMMHKKGEERLILIFFSFESDWLSLPEGVLSILRLLQCILRDSSQ